MKSFLKCEVEADWRIKTNGSSGLDKDGRYDFAPGGVFPKAAKRRTHLCRNKTWLEVKNY
jgi:hypothetical protein